MQEKGIFFFFFCVGVCVLFVHTMLSRFGSQVFRQGQKQIIIIIILISNIIMHCRVIFAALNTGDK